MCFFVGEQLYGLDRVDGQQAQDGVPVIIDMVLLEHVPDGVDLTRDWRLEPGRLIPRSSHHKT